VYINGTVWKKAGINSNTVQIPVWHVGGVHSAECCCCTWLFVNLFLLKGFGHLGVISTEGFLVIAVFTGAWSWWWRWCQRQQFATIIKSQSKYILSQLYIFWHSCIFFDTVGCCHILSIFNCGAIHCRFSETVVLRWSSSVILLLCIWKGC